MRLPAPPPGWLRSDLSVWERKGSAGLGAAEREGLFRPLLAAERMTGHQAAFAPPARMGPTTVCARFFRKLLERAS